MATFPRPETWRWTKRTVIGCLTCRSNSIMGGPWPIKPAIDSRPSAVSLKVWLRETTRKVIKAALKLCVHVICYIWVTLRTCLWNGFPNCPGASQHSLPHLAHPIKLVSSLVETEMGPTWSGSEKVMRVERKYDACQIRVTFSSDIS